MSILLAQDMTGAHRMPLRWATDSNPGIARKRSGRGFSYLRPDGSRVRDVKTLARIRSLAVPPAWKDVWISTDPLGHIQATGRDARGRKQYRYHPWWRDEHDAAKYDRMIDFARALPDIRARVATDLSTTRTLARARPRSDRPFARYNHGADRQRRIRER